MVKTMLIDATHAEETRVAVVDGHRLVEFDYESKVRKQLKGGIYLAKVTRVEPSLQAAFVNFGGNRHGFLPFSEIHPDYFRIPVADREALLAAQAAELEEHDEHADEEDHPEGELDHHDDEEDDEDEEDLVEEVGGEDKPAIDDEDVIDVAAGHSHDDDHEEDEDEDHDEEDHDHDEHASFDHDHDEEDEEDEDDESAPGNELVADGDDADGNRAPDEEGEGRPQGGRGRRGGGGRGRGRGGRGRGRRAEARSRSVEMLGGDGTESDRPFRYNLRRQYKIQEVIKRGQIMLIQVSKEERGNKGAAVTSYLSLPGRYCVLMPNSPRGGGVSRKIANFQDRQRMKDVLSDLEVPDGMSVILRTAGLERTKVEIKRDLDYLTRLWNTIREDTLKSSAPAAIYEEGNLIKRAIRDLYGRDIEEVFVAGDEGYKTARDFMKMLMPSHVKKVQEYKDARIPLFHRYKVESQISDIGRPSVTLRSGGYLVINPTEALVSIDVNSGRATRERHIEETALKTNLEAAEEVARQLRLRDLGGLIVIDFIDMEDRRNNRKVEQKLKQALSNDRARIQVGRISSFGLLELSRQRLNPSLTEAQFEQCPHCVGTGTVRTQDFAAISFLRALEEEGIKGRASEVAATLPDAVALYILNHKSQMLADIEARYGLRVHIRTSDDMPRSEFQIDILKKSGGAAVEADEPDDQDSDKEEDRDQRSNSSSSEQQDGEEKTGRRRRRGRRGGRRRGNRTGEEQQSDSEQPEGAEFDSSQDEGDEAQDGEENFNVSEEGEQQDERSEGQGRRRRRGGRGRRGGRNRNRDGQPREGQTAEAGEGDRAPVSSREPAERVAEAPVAAATRVSNDDAVLAAPPKKDYEKVNEAPEQKKKGWWNRLSK